MADWYIDFGATNDGDGTAANQAASGGAVGAFKTIVGKTFSSGDSVWFRRSSTSLTIVSTLTLTTYNVQYIGWPISGDPDFARRPASGTSNSWDSDSSAQLPTMTSAGASLFQIQTNTFQTFQRLKFTNSSSTAVSLLTTNITTLLNNCFFQTAMNASLTAMVLPAHTSGLSTWTNCTFATTGTASNSAINFQYSSGGYVVLSDCTFTKTNQQTGSSMLNFAGNPLGGALVRRCTFTTNSAGNTATTTVLLNQSSWTTPIFIQDCTCDNSTSNAAGEYNVRLNGSAIVRNLSVKGTGVNATISVAGTQTNHMMHFSGINQTYQQNTGALQVVDTNPRGCIIVIDNLICHASNTNDITTTEGTLILINNASFQSGTPVTGTADPGVYVALNSATIGAFKHFGRNGTCLFTSSVTRSGGWASGALKFNVTGSGLNSRSPLVISPPGHETLCANLVAGTNTITIFGGYDASYSTPPSAEDVWFDIEYLDQASGAHRNTVSCRAIGTLTSDGSTWSGATLTSFKLAVTVTAGQGCLASIRFYFCKSDASGNSYIDPVAVVT